MTKCEQYLEYERLWSEAAFNGDDALDKEYTSKGLALRDTFSKEDWEELIAQSSGRAKYEYKRMMNAKFPDTPQKNDENKGE